MTSQLWVCSALLFAAGIALAHKGLWLVFFILPILLLLGIKKLFPRCLLIIIFLLGGLYSYLLIAEIPSLKPVNQFTVAGKICSPVQVEDNKTTFILRSDTRESQLKKIRVLCYFPVQLSPGDTVQIRASLKPIPVAGNPGAFNYREYMAFQGVYYNCTVKKSTQLELLAPGRGPSAYLARIQNNGEEVIEKALNPEEAAVLQAMLFGKRQELSDEQYDGFQKLGIVHLFAVSGLHAGFLLLLLAWLGRLLGWSPALQFWLGTFSLLAYGTMVGWPVSMMRAALMGILGLLAYYTGRQNQLITALAIAGFTVLLIRPAALFTAGFQLSFAATWGLVYLYPHIRARFPDPGRWLDLILLPLCAELAVLPIVLYHFYLISPVSIISNILVSYLAGFIVIMGFIALFISQFLPGLAAFFLYPAGFSIELILGLVEGLKKIPGAYFYPGDPGLLLPIIYFLALASFLLWLKKRWPRQALWAAGILSLVFVMGILIPWQWENRGQLELTMIDVGQGDAILIKSPRGGSILIDGGGSSFYDVAGSTLIPYLRYRGIRKIDYLINTHPDIDHLQGLERVAGEIHCGALLVPASLAEEEVYHTIREAAPHMPVLPAQKGDRLRFADGMTLEVIYAGDQETALKSWNDHSLLMRLEFQHFSALLTGDLEIEALRSIKKTDYHPCTLIKVPHHGSRGSLLPELYQETRPLYAAISAGYNNQFGHPHPEVVDLLEAMDINIVRTDRDGAVSFFSDGNRLQVSRTLPSGR